MPLGLESTQPVARYSSVNDSTVHAATVSSSAPSMGLTAQQTADIGNAGQILAQGAQAHQTGNQFGAAATAYLESTGDFTAAEIQAEQTGPNAIVGATPWGNGAPETQRWIGQLTTSILSAVGVQSEPDPATVITPPPVIAPPPATPVTNVAGGGSTTSTDPNDTTGIMAFINALLKQPVGDPTSPGPLVTTNPADPNATATPTGGTVTTPDSSGIASLIAALTGSSGSGGGATSTVPGDVGALNAAAPIVTGTPATKTTSGSGETVLIVGAIIVAGGGWYLWHRFHAQRGGPPHA